MRKRKGVYVYCENPGIKAAMTMMLNLQPGVTMRDSRPLFAAVIVSGRRSAQMMARCLEQDIPVIEVLLPRESPSGMASQSVTLGNNVGLREAVKIAVARPRGPKKAA